MGTLPSLKTFEVAKMLDVHVTTVIRLMKSGQIKGYKYGKGYRFFPYDIEQFVQSRKVK